MNVSPLARFLRWATGAWVLIELIGLRIGLLNRFFFDTLHAGVQGIDYYALPKAWLNLSAGRSLFATFDPPAYGPHFTWYLAHPALSILGWPLSKLAPGDSYGLFTMISLGIMAVCAFLLTRETEDPVTQAILWPLFLCAFPTFDMLFVGNVQEFLVLGLTLLFIGMLRTVRVAGNAGRYILAGLLVSLFTKPVVLIMLPLLLLLRETRRATGQALAVYLPISFLFEVVPALNPEGIGLPRTVWLALHPGFVRSTMDIYRNNFALTPDMRDNSIHWFNLVAQSGFRLMHVDVFSLPVFLDTLLHTHTPDWLYLFPGCAVLLLSPLTARIREARIRAECALLLILAASLSFFLSYPTVWEYQYTSVLPAAAVLMLLRGSALLGPFRKWAVALAACAWLPSLYFLSGDANPSTATITMVRLDRVVPVTALFVLLVYAVARTVFTAFRNSPSVATPRQDYSSPVQNPV